MLLDKLGSGINQLIADMTTHLFLMKGKEARLLYDEIHKKVGHLSRQPGESMVSYLQRWDRAVMLIEEIRR